LVRLATALRCSGLPTRGALADGDRPTLGEITTNQKLPVGDVNSQPAYKPPLGPPELGGLLEASG
jgi:hypothetical protein